MARAMAQQTRFKLMEEWIGQYSGRSANGELSRAYGLPDGLFDAWKRPHNQAVPVQPSMSARGVSGGWNYYQSGQVHFPPVTQQRYAYWPQQTNVSQFTPAPAPAPVPVPVPVSAPVPAFAPAPAPVRARYATVDVSDLCPPMEHEETEVVALESIEDECPTFEAVDVSYAATEPASAPVYAMIETSELCFADEHEEAQIAP
ncbi:hypothetical protein E4U52_008179, partial [Claviceps spartinae]